MLRNIRLLPKFSLLIIVLVAVIVFVAFTSVSTFASRAFREQEMQSIANYHERLSKYINDDINSISITTLLYMSRNISFGGLGDIEGNVDKRTVLFKNLQVLLDTNPGIQSVYFFSGVEKKVLYYTGGALSIMPFDEFYDIALYYNFISDGGYNNFTGMRLVPATFQDVTRAKPLSYTNVASFVKRVPLRGHTYDVVVVNIGSSYFHNLMRSSNLPPASVMAISDVEGDSLICYPIDEAYTGLDAADYQDLPQQAMGDGRLAPRFSYSMHGKEFFVATSRQHMDRVYYSLVPYQNLAPSYSHVNMVMILIELILLGVGVCLAIFATNTITRPIDAMLKKIKGVTAAQGPPRKLLIDYPLLREMDEQIDEMVIKNREQANILDRYFHSYRESTFMSLLTGSRQYSELPTAMQSIPAGYQAYAVLACRSYGDDDPPNASQWESLAELTSKRLTQFGHVEWAMASPRQVAFIISLVQVGDAVVKSMESALYEVLELRPFSQAAEFAIGRAFADPEDIPISYLYANEAFDKTIDAPGAVVTYSSLTPQFVYVNIQRRHDLIEEAVRDGDLERAIGEINIFFALTQKADFHMDQIRKHCLLLLVYVTSGVSRDNPNHAFVETIRQMLEDARTVDDLRVMLINEIETIVTGTVHEDVASAASVEMIERVKSYVDNHYHENISLGIIADYVFFTPQYLGKLFKDVTGTTFTNYIIHVRMNAAQSLLTSSKLPVASIASAVGYTNVQSFGRTFKSFFGCTPGEYRRRTGITDIEEEE